MDRRAWWAVVHVVAESDTTYQLSAHTHTHTHTQAHTKETEKKKENTLSELKSSLSSICHE